ncbi:BTAD domain-containing putative transcriptional regulator [Lentzea nigeriaca]|uniref:BTAD domain-containing putative transcriptional regulator n=1 Tax=Lentzea nigeriaca TaxID=1128665 RepID=UPI001956FD43|nr:BTAD domain-containing putative transcriptional regulator [Lentzea nigeriaca]MBM7864988.1 DNA-binding SARP family transcriptional activator [Lentzea nigeriaca]
MDRLRIHLLGGFHVRVGIREVADGHWRLRKAKALVKLLALAPGHRLHRDRVIEFLWPDLEWDAGLNQLRKTVHAVRDVLDPDRREGFLLSGEQLGLRRDAVWVDVAAFETAVLVARGSGTPAAYREAIGLYRGDLLPEDRYEDWVLAREGPLRAEFVALAVELARMLEARADFAGAAAALRRVVELDPAHEEAGAALMRVYALAGRGHEAVVEYERLRATLRDELGVEPSAVTQRLFEQIKAGRLGDAEVAGDLWDEIGDLRALSGDSAGAATAFRSAVRALRGQGLREVVVHRKAAQAYLAEHDTESAQAHVLAAEALLARHADEAESARLLTVRANLRWETGEYDQAQHLAEQALALADQAGTPDDIAAAHEALAIACHYRGAWREGLHAEIERLGTRAEVEPRLARIFEMHCCIGQYHLYGDGLRDSVEDYARTTLALAIDKHARHAEAFAWCLLGEALLLRGRWDESESCLVRSTEVYADLGARTGVLPWQRLAELAVGRGDSERAASCLRHGMAIATITPLAPHAWGRLYATAAFDAVERGEPVEAIRAVRSAAEAAERYGDCPSCRALLNPVAAEAFATLGEQAAAAEFAEAARQVASMFESTAWRGMAESANGALALARDDPVAARDRFLAAARLYDAARQPYWAARSRLQVARAGGDPDSAVEAAVTFERLGAVRALSAALSK